MPLFGAHMSIAGGCHNALLAAEAHGMETAQLFTKNNNQWNAKPLSEEDIGAFRQHASRIGFRSLTAHDSYLINLASPDPILYRKSVEAFVIEMQRAEQLGLAYLVMHPGSHMTDTEENGLARVALALDEAHARCPGFALQVLLETTAGQGTNLGHRFEHLGRILQLVKEPDRLGVCLDTCHVFAAGYPLAPRKDYLATMKAFDRAVGLDRLRVFHLNDSQKPQGSRVDRHAHIGQGHLGLEPFRLLVNDRRFRGLPMVLETPKEPAPEGDVDMDTVNLRLLREMLA